MKSLIVLFPFTLISLYAHIIPPFVFEKINQRLQRNKNDIEALIVRAHYFSHTEKYLLAIKDLEHIKKITGNKVNGLYLQIGDLYFKAQKFDKALFYYEAILTTKFYNRHKHVAHVPISLWQKSIIYFQKKQYQKAWKNAQIAQKELKQSYTVLLKTAQMAEKSGAIEEAIATYSKALLKFPSASCEPFLVKALRLQIETKQFKRAQQVLFELTQKLQRDPLACYYYALLAKLHLKNPKLFKHYINMAQKRVQKMEKNTLESLYWKARIALTKEQYPQALDFINRAIEQDKQRPALFLIRSKVYKKLLQQKKASKDYALYQKLHRKTKEDWLPYFTIPGGD